jgi:hypothetical protein
VGKSPPQNGVAALERTSSDGGLGEGTPKVCLFLWNIYISLKSLHQSIKKVVNLYPSVFWILFPKSFEH